MDNNKRGIGDNSTEGKFTSIFEKEAVSEMMRDMKGFAKEAEQLIYKLSDALTKITTGKDNLHTSMSDDLDVMIERVTDVSATVNAYQDPSNFKDWVEVARNGGKSDE